MADGAVTSAKRKRERRLRSVLRHERQTVAMELAAALHHSRDAGLGTCVGLRAQRTASSGQRPGVLTELEREPQEGGSHGRLRGCPSAAAGGPSSRRR